MTSDPDQKAVYAAEDQLAAWLDLVTPDQPAVSVDGLTYEPETEPRFTDPAAVGRFVAQDASQTAVHERVPEVDRVPEWLQRARRARRRAGPVEVAVADAVHADPAHDLMARLCAGRRRHHGDGVSGRMQSVRGVAHHHLRPADDPRRKQARDETDLHGRC